MGIPEPQLTAYYRAARAGLHYVESRRPGGRRFGSDADSRWKAFAGGLTAAARLDLLIRDANAEWPGAFGARTVFELNQVAEDDAFGPLWTPLDPVLAEELWRAPVPEIGSPRSALEAVAAAWDLELTPFKVPPIDPAQKIWVAGPSAIASLAEAFAAGVDLDWAAQVTCVATPPSHRQLAGFAAAVADGTKPSTVLSEAAAGTPPARVTALISDDAAAPDREILEQHGTA